MTLHCGKTKLEIGFFFVLGLSLYAAVVPARLLVVIFSAAAVHECTHLLLLRKFARQPQKIVFGPFGLRMSSECFALLDYKKEILCTLGAPLVNLLCGVLFFPFAHRSELLAKSCAVHLSLALFNLLPLRILDGGRVLQCFLLHCGNVRLENRVTAICDRLVFFALCLVLFLFYRNTAPNMTVLVFLFYLVFLAFFQK